MGELIRVHAASMVVQRCWFRYTLFRHATRSVVWGEIRSQLMRLGVFGTLFKYSKVRREWRLEAESWRDLSLDELTILISECEDGWWGDESRRIAAC